MAHIGHASASIVNRAGSPPRVCRLGQRRHPSRRDDRNHTDVADGSMSVRSRAHELPNGGSGHLRFHGNATPRDHNGSI